MRTLTSAVVACLLVLPGACAGGSTSSTGTPAPTLPAPTATRPAPGVPASPAEGTLSSDGLTTKDVTHWTLPTDPYTYPSARLTKAADEKFTKECMAKAGYTYPIPTYNLDAPPNPYMSPAGADLFNIETASVIGYHRGPDPSYDQIAYTRVALADNAGTEAEDAALQACLARMEAELPAATDANGWNLNEPPAIKLRPIAGSETPQAKATLPAWRQCMAPLGIPDLPDSPEVAASVYDKYVGTNQDDPAGDFADGTNVTADEIRIAVADATCRTTSGFEQAAYDAEWNAAEQVLAANRTALEARRAEILAHEEQLRAYLATS